MPKNHYKLHKKYWNGGKKLNEDISYIKSYSSFSRIRRISIYVYNISTFYRSRKTGYIFDNNFFINNLF